MYHLFLIGRCDTVAADNKKEALECWFETTGETAVDYEDLDIERIPGDREIRILFDEEPDPAYPAPYSARRGEDEDYWYIEAAAAEWARFMKYAEILCSTEW